MEIPRDQMDFSDEKGRLRADVDCKEEVVDRSLAYRLLASRFKEVKRFSSFPSLKSENHCYQSKNLIRDARKTDLQEISGAGLRPLKALSDLAGTIPIPNARAL